MLVDAFARQFSYLRLSLTDACNFKCQYCLPNGYSPCADKVDLSLDEIRTLVHSFARLGMSKVRLTGGEPSLRKDLCDIIALVAQTQGVKQVAMTTNGFRLARDGARWRDAGLTHINVSLDSLDPNVFNAITGTQSFNKVMEGINHALTLNFDAVKLNAVLMANSGQKEFSRYLAWLKDKPLQVRFIELMETGAQRDFFAKSHLNGQGFKQYLLEQGWHLEHKNATSGPAQLFSHRDYQGKIGLILPYEKDFCSTCNRLRVSSQGKLHLCLFTEQGIDLRPLLQQGREAQLDVTIRQALLSKKPQHYLDEHNTGATMHFASIGG